MRRTAAVCTPFALLLVLPIVGCNWLSLAEHALTYPTLARGDAGNVASFDTLVVVTAGANGFTVRNAVGATLVAVPPAPNSESVDDIAMVGDLCFTLDATAPGHLSVWSLRDPLHPVLVASAREVAVGPFSGVAAAAGTVVVSGGTSSLSVWRYQPDGELVGPVDSADLGRGQPDVLLARDGRMAYVSTHNWGPYFELDLLPLERDASGALHATSRVALPGAGFTDGGAKPANFPIVSALLDDSTLLVAHARGVTLINVADPRHAFVRDVIGLMGPAVHVVARDRRAAVSVAGAYPEVVILDFSTDNTPRVRRVPLRPGTNPLAVAMSRVGIAVAVREQGILTLKP